MPKYQCSGKNTITSFVVIGAEVPVAYNVPFVLSKNLILAIGIVPSSVVAEVTFSITQRLILLRNSFIDVPL